MSVDELQKRAASGLPTAGWFRVRGELVARNLRVYDDAVCEANARIGDWAGEWVGWVDAAGLNVGKCSSASKPPPIKVGDPVWFFDTNRRVYAPGSSGHPIYREHFRPAVILGETPRSWVIGHAASRLEIGKVPKRGGDVRVIPDRYGGTRVYMTAQAVEDDVYMKDNQGRLCEQLSLCNDPAVLRAVAALLDKDSKETT